ncbi:TetR/AcrR family transcriptional regulator [Nocardia sp. CA-135953]|uniref:TetR/AcrR family transcriptional regulator n=1 Tax=Nocardia sp. CA-135953 TaxID=3239978 RepID=UPI003D97AD2C
MAESTRARMVTAAVESLRRRGLAGMSFTEVLADSGAARGAIYHHFPGGKAQLVTEAAQLHGQQVADRLTDISGASPRAVVEAFLDLVRPVVEDSTRGCGCAIAAVTVSVDDDHSELLRTAAAAFASWAHQLAVALTDAGMPEARAEDLAQLLIALLEGAQVLCRADSSTTAFEQAARAALAATP